jgi:hypothetical protein
MPVEWIDRIGTTWSLGPHPIAVKNQARAVLERIAPFSEEITEEVVKVWIARSRHPSAPPGRRTKRRRGSGR